MTEREPVDVTNLTQYGEAALPWSQPRDLRAASPPPNASYFLGTVRPGGRPYSAGIGALWHDGDFYIVGGLDTRKSRNLAANPACTLSVGMPDLDLVFEGEVARVTDPSILEVLAERYRAGGWPAEAEDDTFTAPFTAPSAGPPPWHLYRFTFHTAVGVAGAEPFGATRWRFDV